MQRRNSIPVWIYDFLLIAILLVGAYLRFTGINWDEDSYNHPDERFLAMTTASLQPVSSLADYFNTDHSTLNPNNTGSSFYVYGTFPLILVRYVVDWIGQNDLHEIKLVGRAFSASLDLLTVFLAYLIAARLYKRKTALLTACFSVLAVLQIQQSHFFTVDTFVNFFIFLAIYFAVKIGTTPPALEIDHQPKPRDLPAGLSRQVKHPWFWSSILFGLSLGAAMACKINAAPVTLMLPGAILLQLSRHPQHERVGMLFRAAAYLALAALVSLLVFRILQPYSFSGPGFFGVSINSKWVSAIQSQSVFSSRDVDYYPPAYQWARRPIWFSLRNLLLWGLGLPLGLLAWVGFLWAGWRMLKGELRQHILLWGWTGAFFAWQSLAFNATMRYQLPIYPSLAIFAAWAISAAWDASRPALELLTNLKRRLPWKRIAVAATGGVVILATLAWAFAFVHIYQQPLTRVAASRWIFQNLPGPINVRVQTSDGVHNQPLSFPYGQAIQPGVPYENTFVANASGELNEIYLAHVLALEGSTAKGTLHMTISGLPGGQAPPLAEAYLAANFSSPQSVTINLDNPTRIFPQTTFYITFVIPDGSYNLDLCQPITLTIDTSAGMVTQSVNPPDECLLSSNQPLSMPFQPTVEGVLQCIGISQVSGPQVTASSQTLLVIVSSSPWQEHLLTQIQSASLAGGASSSTNEISYPITQPASIQQGDYYLVRLWLDGVLTPVTLQGTALANEGAWDDGLPFRVDGYDGFGGIYVPNLNFNMYDDDNPDKLARFESILDQADYVAISSNRQWGSLTRLPERFPLTTLYYQDLLGCPPDKSITWCYTVAQPGMFTGSLGYELVEVFESDPTIGPLHINDQFAEEAFTVYDHPKVLIFKKTASYSSTKVRTILSSVDLTKIIPVKPGQAGSFPANLMLPAGRWLGQMAEGTWSTLFDTYSILNQDPAVGAVVWYLAVALLGLLVYPLVRLAFPGLSDRGYPLARTVGLLLLALLVWLAGSSGIPFSRLTISLALLLLAIAGIILAYVQRAELKSEWKTKRNYFLAVELVALLFFAIDLSIRLGNPDLWHPAYGGEKPMDFSFFNAVLKSTTFPPYDPWFSGGIMNYYYYGFVIVGVLVKWLGIVPSVAYNLILPTLFSLLALGAFCIGWNLSGGRRVRRLSAPINDSRISIPDSQPLQDEIPPPSILKNRQLWIGLAAATALVILGNLGTVRMIWQGFQLMVVSSDTANSASFLTRIGWSFQGLVKWLGGAHLPYSAGQWYWIPSRAIQPEAGNEITEFPFFSFLYADLHASTMALPVAGVVIAWALSVFLGKARWGEPDGRFKWISHALCLLVGAVAIGALRPTNTWDIYTYLPLGAIALGYSVWGSTGEAGLPFYRRLAGVAVDLGLLAGLSILLYQPFSAWFGQAYSQIIPWHGNHTIIWSYLVHWGVFLFVIFCWMTWESLEWMASTPLTSLAKLRPYFYLIGAGLGALALIIIALMALDGVQIAWLPLLMGAWAAVLIFRPGQPDTKRAVLFLIGTALTLTLVVEVIVLRGDINRQNTVFKLYLQAWTLFAVSSAAALGWIWQALPRWRPNWRLAWRSGFYLLAAGAMLCTVTMTFNKIIDRMTPSAPLTLDGMAFMKDAVYFDGIPNSGTGENMLLEQDYQAILWMQENVAGTPVIVEAAAPDYHWSGRFSIYTGLPGVIDWAGHEIQQRALVPSTWVLERQDDIQQFYQTTDPNLAEAFLQKYKVSYIIVGQYERLWYPGPGLAKFEALSGGPWQIVFQYQDTTIYQVNNP